MPYKQNNTTLMPMWAGIQQEIDRIIERAGAFFCEEDEADMVVLEQMDDEEVISTLSLANRTAHTYTKYPAILHGRYSIPKHWVSDEDVEKVVIIEDVPKTKTRQRRGRGVAWHLYRTLAF